MTQQTRRSTYNSRFTVDWMMAMGLLLAAGSIHLWSPVYQAPLPPPQMPALPFQPADSFPLIHVLLCAVLIPMLTSGFYHLFLQGMWHTYGDEDEDETLLQYTPLQDDNNPTFPLDMTAIAQDTAWYGGKALYFWADLHHIALTAFSSIAISLFVTEMLKSLFGFLRPDFYARCQWSPTLERCLALEGEVIQARRSFPSSHAAIILASSTIIHLYLNTKLLALSTRTIHVPRLPYLILVASPLLAGVWTSMYSYYIHENSPLDIVIGGVIGSFLSWLTFNLYFGIPSSPLTASEASLARRVKV